MAKRRASEYETLIQFYKPGKTEPPSPENNFQIIAGEPEPYKKVWCHVEVVFREQLEAYLNGVTINRNRVRLYMRMRDDIDSTMMFEYKEKLYHISIYGPYKGEFQLLGEASEDGGS